MGWTSQGLNTGRGKKWFILQHECNGSKGPPSLYPPLKSRISGTTLPPPLYAFMMCVCVSSFFFNVTHHLASKCVNFLFNYGFGYCQHLLQSVGTKPFLRNSPSVSQHNHTAVSNNRQAAGYVFYSRPTQPFILCGNFVKIWPAYGEHDIQ
jgi:hypothetical protein